MWNIVGKLSRPALGGCLFVSMALLVGGCSRPPGTVEGTVSFKGKPLTSGSIVFYAQPDNNPFPTKIDSDGTYKLTNVPAGPVKVAVATEPAPHIPLGMPMSAEKMGGPAGEKFPGDPELIKKNKGGSPAAKSKTTTPKYVQIPDTYKDPEKSGLNYTIKSGRQRIDVDLK